MGWWGAPVSPEPPSVQWGLVRHTSVSVFLKNVGKVGGTNRPLSSSEKWAVTGAKPLGAVPESALAENHTGKAWLLTPEGSTADHHSLIT